MGQEIRDDRFFNRRTPLTTGYLLLCLLTSQATQSPAAHAQTTTPPLSTVEIARRAKPATATIVTLDAQGDTLGQGSGFFLGPDGVLVTNWHVLRGGRAAAVTLADGSHYEQTTFLAGDSLADVVLLKLAAHDPAMLTPHDSLPAIGEPVVAIGSPLGLSATVSTGIVSATREIDGVRVVQISAPLGPGSSGAPILDGHGHVVAIATGYAEGAPYIGFATPVGYALQLLNDAVVEQPIGSRFGAKAPALAGRRARESKPTTPVDVYRDSTEPNDPAAEYDLGLRYAAGLGVQRDPATAARWFRRAADHGFAPAQYQLGVLYAVGQGVVQNDVEAARWVRKAAEGGVAAAQYELGMFYASGVGVPANAAYAVAWYRKAADQDHAQAQYNLGAMYRAGRGVPQDTRLALEWYHRAADQNVPEAQHNLGVLYAVGDGVDRDLVEAYKWFTLAATRHPPRGLAPVMAARLRDGLAGHMDAAEIAEAERRAAEWPDSRTGGRGDTR